MTIFNHPVVLAAVADLDALKARRDEAIKALAAIDDSAVRKAAIGTDDRALAKAIEANNLAEAKARAKLEAMDQAIAEQSRVIEHAKDAAFLEISESLQTAHRKQLANVCDLAQKLSEAIAAWDKFCGQARTACDARNWRHSCITSPVGLGITAGNYAKATRQQHRLFLEEK